MSESIHHLVDRIRTDLIELDRVVQRAEKGWQRARQATDDYYLDGVALNIHGFYNGLERIFERIAAIVDGSKPVGEAWHQALLQQMNTEVSNIRPAVISDVVREQLDEYRGFRHVVRNVYTFNFDPVRVGRLTSGLRSLFTQAKTELLAFADFLEEQAKDQKV
jgi:hypothetical protein